MIQMETGRKSSPEPLLSEEERGCRVEGRGNVLARQAGAGVSASALAV